MTFIQVWLGTILKRKCIVSVQYDINKGRIQKHSPGSYGFLKRNPKAIQIIDDLNTDTVMNGIEKMRAENAMLVEKGIDAPEGNYIQGEDADDHIEQLTKANEDLIKKVSEIGNMVVGAITKAKSDQNQDRRKYREEVMMKNKEDIALEDPDFTEKLQEKKKLYWDVNKLRKEVNNLKIKLKSLGSTENIERNKNENKHLVEENYKLLEEIKVLNKIKNKQNKAIQELKETNPETQQSLDNNKQKVVFSL